MKLDSQQCHVGEDGQKVITGDADASENIKEAVFGHCHENGALGERGEGEKEGRGETKGTPVSLGTRVRASPTVATTTQQDSTSECSLTSRMMSE